MAFSLADSWLRVRRRVRAYILSHPGFALLIALTSLTLFYLGLASWVEKPRLVSVMDATFGGLIASLATYSLVQYFILEKSYRNIRKWLAFGPPRRLWVVPTMITHPSEPRYPMPYYVVPPFDAQAAGVLTEVARQARFHYPERRVQGSHALDESILHDNFILMCLPSRNLYSRIFLGLLHDIYENGRRRADVVQRDYWLQYLADEACQLQYYGLNLRRERDKQEWRMLDHSENGPNRWKTSSINAKGFQEAHSDTEYPIDVAMVLRTQNPFNPQSSILLVSGIHGVGTFGASIWVYQEARHLLQQFGAKPQAHVLEIQYRISNRTGNYVDSSLVRPFKHLAFKELPQM